MPFAQKISQARPSMGRRLFYLASWILTTLPAADFHIYAQEPASREIPVVYQTLQGKFQSSLLPITAETPTVEIADSTVPLGDLIEIEFSGQIPASRASATLILRDGGFWRGRFDLRRLDGGDQVFWNSPSLTQVLELPLESIGSYLAAGVKEDPFTERSGDSDLLLTSDGARLSGILESLDPGQITFDDESLGLLKIEWAKVQAFQLVALGDENEAGPKSENHVDVFTRDGSTPRGSLLRLDSEEIRLRDTTGQEVRIPTDRILRVKFANDRVVSLTDRTPLSADEGLGEGRWFPWTWQKDRNVLGAPLSIGARKFDRGIGVHSNSTLTFEIKEGDLILNGYAGMDASARPKDEEPEIGNARFSILVDSKVVWGPHDLSWKDAPRSFSIPLETRKTFSLKVEMGSGIHILDRANWVATQILRK